MFRLLRYYAIASAIAMVLVSTALVVLYRHTSMNDLLAATEAQNAVLARSFANSLLRPYFGYVATAGNLAPDELRARPETRQLDAALRALTVDLPVLKVKIYDLEGVTVYSSQASQIGEDKGSNPGYLAARAGMPASKLSSRGEFSAFSGIVADVDLVESYVPIRGPGGDVRAVFELYYDVSPQMARVRHTVNALLATLLAVFGVLYLSLFLIVRRGDGILKGQYRSLQRSERDVRAKNLELKYEIAERKRAEAELAKRERLATLGQLTATVSHELRNPLGTMRTSAFLLRNLGAAVDSPEFGRALERLDTSIVRCDKIIDELLDFTRFRDIDVAPTPLDDWVDDVLAEQTMPEGIVLRRERGAADAIIALDRDIMRRALVNVVDNARQAMDGAGALAVRTAFDGARARITVEDDGPGIADDVLPHIFEPLYSTRGFGVGLGLAVVRQIMDQHGGGVELATEVGRGTRVTLWLPVREARMTNVA